MSPRQAGYVADVFLAYSHDLIIIGGGVGGYVAAIKAGQEGLKVWIILSRISHDGYMAYGAFRWLV